MDGQQSSQNETGDHQRAEIVSNIETEKQPEENKAAVEEATEPVLAQQEQSNVRQFPFTPFEAQFKKWECKMQKLGDDIEVYKHTKVVSERLKRARSYLSITKHCFSLGI